MRKLVKIRLTDISLIMNRTGEPSLREQFLAELAFDIKTNGLREPFSVIQDGDKFIVFSGRRRALACKLAGLTEVDVWLWDIKTPAEMCHYIHRQGTLHGETRKSP